MAIDLQEPSNAYAVSLSAQTTDDFPYRALSRGAIASMILAVLAVIGLVPGFQVFLVLAVFGIAAAIMGLRITRLYPREYSGRMLAKVALTANLLLLLGGVGEHAYIYATEVPEGYQRVHFYSLQQPATAIHTEPTEAALALNKQKIFLKGYIHPSAGSGQLNRFVLVPDLGTCCFGGQPKSTDMVEVTLTGGHTVRASLLKVKLAGDFFVTPHGAQSKDFENPVYYRLRADYAK